MDAKQKKRPTRLFLFYVFQLVLRLVAFVVGVYLFVRHPDQLDFTTRFGLTGGLDFVDVAFVLLVLDLATKFIPHAKISMGSLKQYREFHVPTFRLFGGGTKELRERAYALMQQVPELLSKQAAHTYRAIRETGEGVLAAGQQFAYTIDVLRVLPWHDKDLTATEVIRSDIRKRRLREIVPVIVFWVLFNVVIALLLERFGVLNERVLLLWTLFYFVFDMISVVLWCPLQLVLMRNRCCTTCQIFNWDGVMTVTPLLLAPCWFSALLIVLALVVLVRWELAFARHPERFDDRMNASLQCANCKDKLCYLRGPFIPKRG